MLRKRQKVRVRGLIASLVMAVSSLLLSPAVLTGNVIVFSRSFEQLIAEAEFIVLGTVTQVTTSKATIRADRILKGNHKPTTIKVVFSSESPRESSFVSHRLIFILREFILHGGKDAPELSMKYDQHFVLQIREGVVGAFPISNEERRFRSLDEVVREIESLVKGMK